MNTINDVVRDKVMVDYLRQQGIACMEWPEAKGGGFIVHHFGNWVLCNCEDEGWCKAWGKMATIHTTEDLRGLIESMESHVAA